MIKLACAVIKLPLTLFIGLPMRLFGAAIRLGGKLVSVAANIVALPFRVIGKLLG